METVDLSVNYKMCTNLSLHPIFESVLVKISFYLLVERGRDPNAVAVLLEDSAALVGVLLASGCLGLASHTGNYMFDALGSITIGGK